MNTAIISPAESDTILASYSAWTGLTNAQKTFFIERASVYVQTQYTCADITWEGAEENIPEEVETAVAFFAYADSSGNLFGDPAEADQYKGKMRSERKQLGDLVQENSWYRGGKTSPSGVARSLGYPHMLMSIHCTYNHSTEIDLVRV